MFDFDSKDCFCWFVLVFLFFGFEMDKQKNTFFPLLNGYDQTRSQKKQKTQGCFWFFNILGLKSHKTKKQ